MYILPNGGKLTEKDLALMRHAMWTRDKSFFFVLDVEVGRVMPFSAVRTKTHKDIEESDIYFIVPRAIDDERRAWCKQFGEVCRDIGMPGTKERIDALLAKQASIAEIEEAIDTDPDGAHYCWDQFLCDAVGEKVEEWLWSLPVRIRTDFSDMYAGDFSLARHLREEAERKEDWDWFISRFYRPDITKENEEEK